MAHTFVKTYNIVIGTILYWLHLFARLNPKICVLKEMLECVSVI